MPLGQERIFGAREGQPPASCGASGAPGSGAQPDERLCEPPVRARTSARELGEAASRYPAVGWAASIWDDTDVDSCDSTEAGS